MTTKTLTVSIGRGSSDSDKYLSGADWWTFRTKTIHLVEIASGGEIYSITDGHGYWTDEESGLRFSEACSTITAAIDVEAAFGEAPAYLRRHLRELAKRYRQDAIALTIGDTELVPGGPF